MDPQPSATPALERDYTDDNTTTIIPQQEEKPKTSRVRTFRRENSLLDEIDWTSIPYIDGSVSQIRKPGKRGRKRAVTWSTIGDSDSDLSDGYAREPLPKRRKLIANTSSSSPKQQRTKNEIHHPHSIGKSHPHTSDHQSNHSQGPIPPVNHPSSNQHHTNRHSTTSRPSSVGGATPDAAATVASSCSPSSTKSPPETITTDKARKYAQYLAQYLRETCSREETETLAKTLKGWGAHQQKKAQEMNLPDEIRDIADQFTGQESRPDFITACKTSPGPCQTNDYASLNSNNALVAEADEKGRITVGNSRNVSRYHNSGGTRGKKVFQTQLRISDTFKCISEYLSGVEAQSPRSSIDLHIWGSEKKKNTTGTNLKMLNPLDGLPMNFATNTDQFHAGIDPLLVQQDPIEEFVPMEDRAVHPVIGFNKIVSRMFPYWESWARSAAMASAAKKGGGGSPPSSFDGGDPSSSSSSSRKILHTTASDLSTPIDYDALLSSRHEPAVIDVAYEQILLCKPFGGIPPCSSGQNCIMKYMNRQGDPKRRPSYVGMSYTDPSQMKLIMQGKLSGAFVAQSNCYACLCISQGVMINNAELGNTPISPVIPPYARSSATHAKPTTSPSSSLGDDDDVDVDLNNSSMEDTQPPTMKDHNEVDAPTEPKQPQPFSVEHSLIEFPFRNACEVPGGFSLKAVYQPMEDMCGVGPRYPIRHFVLTQYAPSEMQVTWADSLDGGSSASSKSRLHTKIVPTYTLRSDLHFRPGNRYSANPAAICPYIRSELDVKPLTTEYLLRCLFQKEEDVVSTIQQLGGNISVIFPDIGDPTSKSRRQRGYIIRTERMNTYTPNVKNDVETGCHAIKFRGRVYDKLFSDSIEETAQHLEVLLEAFGYLKTYPTTTMTTQSTSSSSTTTERKVSNRFIVYPYWNLSNLIAFDSQELHQGRSIYHALHLRVNVCMGLHKLYVGTKKGGSKSRCLKGLILFLHAHNRLVKHFRTFGEAPLHMIQDEELLTVIPSHLAYPYCRDLRGWSHIPEFRPWLHVLLTPSDVHLSAEDLQYTQITTKQVHNDPPHQQVRRFFRTASSKVFHGDVFDHLQRIFSPPPSSSSSSSSDVESDPPPVMNHNTVINRLLFHDFQCAVNLVQLHSQSIGPVEVQMLLDLTDGFSRWCPFREMVLEFLKLRPKELFQTCSIFMTLLIKISCTELLVDRLYEFIRATHLMNAADVKRDPLSNVIVEACYNLRLILQTYFDLAKYISVSGSFSDVRLKCRRPFAAAHHVLGSDDSFYSLYYPDFYRFFSQSDLIDTAHLSRYIKFLGDKSPSLSDEWIDLCSKALPKSCQKREMGKRHEEMASENPTHMEFIRHLFRASSMGVYVHSRRWPRFDRALQLHTFCGEFYDEERFIRFMNANTQMFKNIINEHITFMSLMDPAYYQTLCTHYPSWNSFEGTTRRIGDHIRKHFDEHGDFEMVEFHINKSTGKGPLIYRKCSKNFVFAMVDAFEKLEPRIYKQCMTYLKDVSTTVTARTPPSSNVTKAVVVRGGDDDDEEEDDRGGNYDEDADADADADDDEDEDEEGDDRSKHHHHHQSFASSVDLQKPSTLSTLLIGLNTTRVTFEEREIIMRYVEALVPGSPVRLDDLYHLGMSEHALCTIGECYAQFERQSMQGIVDTLCDFEPADYDLVYCFFYHMEKHYSISLAPLPYDMTWSQIGALYNRTLDPGIHRQDSPLPYHAQCLLYAPCCSTVKNNLCQGDRLKMSGISRTGPNSVMQDYISEKYYCVKKSNQRKPLEVNYSADLVQILEARSRSRSVFCTRRPNSYKGRFDMPCKSVPLIAIPLLGYRVTIVDRRTKKTRSYTICPRCGGFTIFSIMMWGLNGFTCRVCDQVDSLKEYQEMCDFCLELKPKGQKWFRKEMFDDRRHGGTGELRRVLLCKSCVTSPGCKSLLLSFHNLDLERHRNLVSCITLSDIEMTLDREVVVDSPLEATQYYHFVHPNELLGLVDEKKALLQAKKGIGGGGGIPSL